MAGSNGLPLRQDIGNIAASMKILPTGNALVRPWSLWHRRDVPKAGLSNFTFFNETRSLGVTNIDNQGVLQANNVMAVHGISIGFLPGFDRLGRRLGIASPTQPEVEASLLNGSKIGTTVADPLAVAPLWQEKSRELLYQGNVKFSIGDRLIQDQYGLVAYPEGQGMVSDTSQSTSLSNTTATTINAWNIVRSAVYNGAPLAGNVNRFPTPIGIFPGVGFNITIDYNTPVDFTQQYAGPLYNLANAVTAGVLTVEIFGMLISPVS